MVPDIAFFLPSMSIGGAERISLNLIKDFNQRGLNVHLVLARKTGGFLSQVPRDVSVIDLSAPHFPQYDLLGAVPGLANYLRNEKPTTLFALMKHANLVSIISSKIANANTNLVIGEQNNLTQALSIESVFKRKVINKMVSTMYPHADQIIAVSEGVANDLAIRPGIDREDISVIYNPIVTPDIYEKATEPIEHPWFNPDSPPVILGVGRLHPQKDFSTLIQAFDRIYGRKEARLMIIGEGNERPSLEACVDSRGLSDVVSLPGNVDNLFSYMRESDVFALSSTHEGFGNVIVEAMAVGCPVVSTDCPSGPREILADGKYGPLSPVGDPEKLAENIESALDDPLDSSCLQSRADDFKLETIADEYLNALLVNR